MRRARRFRWRRRRGLRFAWGRSVRPRSPNVDHDLHFPPRRIQQRAETLLDDLIGLDAAGDDLFDRQLAAGDHADDAGPHRHLITPGRLYRDVLQRPQSRIDQRLLDVKTRLYDRAVVAHRFDAGVEGEFDARAFNGRIDPHPLLCILANVVHDADG